MKRTIKLLSLFLSFIMLSALLFGCAANNNTAESTATEVTETSKASSDTDTNEENTSNNNSKPQKQTSSYGLGYDILSTSADRELYAGLNKIVNDSNVVNIYVNDVSALSLDIIDIIRIYKDDHPEVFWLDYWDSYETSDENSNTQKIRPTFIEEGESLLQKKNELKKAIDTALEDAPTSGSDYEKELYVHDWLIKNVDYAYEASKDEDPDHTPIGIHDAYGALVNKEAVCDGYTRAFQLLCSKLGLNAITVYGMGTNNDGDYENHTWNAIEIDGDWYYVDVTYDKRKKGAEDITDGELHYYFNVTTDYIEDDHILFPLYTDDEDSIIYNHTIPQCTATKYNYFNYGVPLLSNLDESKEIVEAIVRAANEDKDSVIIKIDDALSFDDTLNSMVDSYITDWIDEANTQLSNKTIKDREYVYYYDDNTRTVIVILEYT